MKSNVPVVLLGPGLNGIPSISCVDSPTLAGNAVYACCFQAEVILDGAKETGPT